ncbi:hypothetical protein [Marinigracilibium pacificum]|uniref:Lipocalin-like domain-containing protein n=1 Tax=Marinigracilibium pacificum TaxID=2729599 RepID=A0A848ISE6_9BACT|nr:hypothetical protein [Marinigracilibium pacificum]NMM47373.1 hypothetical protein [Marinigracilibium pacificum]
MKTFFNLIFGLVLVLGFVACSDEEVTPLKETVWVESRWVVENCDDPNDEFVEESGCTNDYCYKVIFGETTVEFIESDMEGTYSSSTEYTEANGTITIEGNAIRYEIRGNRMLWFFSDENDPCDVYLEFTAQ